MSLRLRRFSALFAALICASPVVAAQSANTGEHTFYFVHYTVSTTQPAAQADFDRGLTFLYAFNRQASEAAFRAAAAADPKLGMAWWGVAMALGPNINIDMSEDDMLSAAQAAAKAKALEESASAQERALIDAVALRYAAGGDQKKLAGPYARAMQAVARTYPDDPDVQALYLESMLDALTFKSPARGLPDWDSMEDVARIDVQRWPEHIGLLHYFIHLTEPDTSALAIRVADQLASYDLAPPASHLTHMPSHVYVYAGEWAKVAALNRKAVQMDMAQAKDAAIKPEHLDYFFHNLDFWFGGAVMSGNEASALEAAAIVARDNHDATWIAQTRLGHYDAAIKQMDAAGVSKRLTRAAFRTVMYYGLVCAASSRPAETERAIIELDRRFRKTNFTKLGRDIVSARLSEANGDVAKARDLYAAAAKLQDTMNFEDAPPWYFAPRELLAEMDLKDGDAAAAATVAEADLKQHPHGVPALSLLATSYSELGRTDDAARIRREVQSSMRAQ